MADDESIPSGSEGSRATIYDVAARAGVAISTVSRVLNNSDDVSEYTRQRVMQAIDELHFQPDRTAKTLAEQQTRVLAVALPSFITPFHNELMKGIRYRLRNYDYDLLLRDLGSRDPLEELTHFLKRGTVDGLLIVGVMLNEETLNELKAWQTPVVLVGMQQEGLDSYYWDDEAGARKAVEHLLEGGHRRIGMIRTMADVPLQLDRIRGYRTALEAAGIEYDESLVQNGETRKHGGFSEESGYEAMQELMKVDPPVTAVFASSDVQAIGAWKALRDAGYSVPEDVALIGYDDIKTSRFIDLSSMAQKMHKVGEEATQRLIYRLDNPDATERVSELVTPALQVRRSSQA